MCCMSVFLHIAFILVAFSYYAFNKIHSFNFYFIVIHTGRLDYTLDHVISANHILAVSLA